jgi:integral membrane protein (TIGR00529 family)
MLYKRVNLAITLNATALLLGFLGLDWWNVADKIAETTRSQLTISVVLATFGVMWLSQLYKETKFINTLSESLSRIINNPKIVLTMLPAVIGFLPVAGGALMSAPLVDSEAEKLGLKSDRKAYINLWFRHTIFPIYPISQVLILTAALAAVTTWSIIVRQIPVVIVMVIVGYIIGFWKTSSLKGEKAAENSERRKNVKAFLFSFSPILITIVVAVTLSLLSTEFSKQGFDVLVATLVGLAVLIVISKSDFRKITGPLRSRGIYEITFAAYGAFLLGSMMKATGISEMFQSFATSQGIDSTLLLVVVPATLGLLTASALGGISISMPILGAIITLTPRTAALIYMSGFFGYVMAPTHLCFAFTANYFKCSLDKIYKYAIPSFLVTFGTALLVYFLF